MPSRKAWCLGVLGRSCNNNDSGSWHVVATVGLAIARPAAAKRQDNKSDRRELRIRPSEARPSGVGKVWLVSSSEVAVMSIP